MGAEPGIDKRFAPQRKAVDLGKVYFVLGNSVSAFQDFLYEWVGSSHFDLNGKGEGY
jgi:hypothetical protein